MKWNLKWGIGYLSDENHITLKQQNKDNKLAPRCYGPYKVLQRIESMPYKLDLPPSSHIHPIDHVSCLNKVKIYNILFQTILSKINE